MEFIIFICTFLYLIFGIGTTRVLSKLKESDIHLMDILFWPLVLIILACTDDIA
jgi:hypothetical protein